MEPVDASAATGSESSAHRNMSPAAVAATRRAAASDQPGGESPDATQTTQSSFLYDEVKPANDSGIVGPTTDDTPLANADSKLNLDADGQPVTPQPMSERASIHLKRNSISEVAASVLLEEFRATAVTSSAHASAALQPTSEVTQRIAPTVTKPFNPQVIMDGTKLIIKLGRNDKFHFDSPCRILLSTPRIKMEHCNVWTTQATCQDNENTIVIDSGGIGQRFVPIPLSHYGTVYTKEGTVHVVVGGDVRRSKVHSRHLPYKTCNKFQAQYVDDSEDEKTVEFREKSQRIGTLPPKEAVKLIKSLGSDPHGGVVYIKGDESLVRYKLKHDERVELQSGHILAWTLGVRFEYRSICCFRFVSAVLGDGTVWIYNMRRGK